MGHEAKGLTISEHEAIELMTQGLRVISADMHEIGNGVDWSIRPFQAVIARHVLEHSPVPLFVLRQINEVMAPSGHLYVEVPAPETICRHEINPNHYSVMGLTMWGNLISRAGFVVKMHSMIQVLTGVGPDVYFWFIAQKPEENKKDED